MRSTGSKIASTLRSLLLCPRCPGMAILLIPLVVFILGSAVYVLAANPKAQEIGRAALWVGLFFTIAAVSKVVVRLL